jgi:anti-sigma B factor antagonist
MSAVQQSPYDPFSLSVLPDRAEVAVVPVGDLDLASADVLEREVRDLRRAGFDQVVVDLRRVGFVDSTGLRVLLSLRNDAKRTGQTLKVVPGCREVQRIFDVTGTRSLFDWRDY